MDIPLSGIDPHDISAIDDEEEQSYSAAQVLEKLERVGSMMSHYLSSLIIDYYYEYFQSINFSINSPNKKENKNSHQHVVRLVV